VRCAAWAALARARCHARMWAALPSSTGCAINTRLGPERDEVLLRLLAQLVHPLREDRHTRWGHDKARLFCHAALLFIHSCRGYSGRRLTAGQLSINTNRQTHLTTATHLVSALVVLLHLRGRFLLSALCVRLRSRDGTARHLLQLLQASGQHRAFLLRFDLHDAFGLTS